MNPSVVLPGTGSQHQVWTYVTLTRDSTRPGHNHWPGDPCPGSISAAGRPEQNNKFCIVIVSKRKCHHLFAIKSSGRVERLDERRRIANKQCIASSADEHADDGQPDVGDALWRVPTVADTQHVWQRPEERSTVLLRPVRKLHKRTLLFISQRYKSNQFIKSNLVV